MIMQHGKDSFWLQLEVCREYQRARCTRSDVECKFAHPPTNVEVGSNGRVTACYDSIKGRCQRETCKYMHPPAHLKDQLLINGRNHLALKNALLQQHHLQQEPTASTLIAGGAGKTALASQLPTAATMAAAVAAVAAAASASSQQQQHSSSSSGLSLPPLLQHHHLKQHQKHHQQQQQQQPQQQQAALFQTAVAAAAASAAANQQQRQRHQTSASALNTGQHMKQMPMVDPATLAALLAASSMNPFMVQGAYNPASQYSAASAASQYAALAAAISQSNAAAMALQQQQHPAGRPQGPPPCQPPPVPPLPPVTSSLLTGMLAGGSPVSSSASDALSLLAATRLSGSTSPPAYCPPTNGATMPASPASSQSSSCEQMAAYYMTPAGAAMAAILGSQLGPLNSGPAPATAQASTPGPAPVPKPTLESQNAKAPHASGGEPSPSLPAEALYQAPAFSPTALHHRYRTQAQNTAVSPSAARNQSPVNRCKRPRSASPHTGYKFTSSSECHLATGRLDSSKRVRLSSSSTPKDSQDDSRHEPTQQSLTVTVAEPQLALEKKPMSLQEELAGRGAVVIRLSEELRNGGPTTTTTSDAEQSTTLEPSQPASKPTNGVEVKH